MTGARDNLLEGAIGREVHVLRTSLGIMVSDLAGASGLSNGMLPKIENSVISPSLTTLQALSRAFGVPIARFEERRSAVFVKAGEGLSIERRGTRNGHQYHLLGHIRDATLADPPHGPEELRPLPIGFLSIISYPRAGE